MPILGRLLDKYGAKRAIIVIGFLLMTVVFLASFITEIIGLTASYVGLRMTGQGALSLAATTLVARTITYKPGLALGIVGAVGSAGISLAPVGLERLIAFTDIATAWRIEAALVAIIVLPIAFLLPKDLPRTTTETGTHIVIVPETGYTSGQALRTGMFWVLASAGFMVGMLSTGLAFHLISILGAQGLSTLEAAANFVPQTVAAVIATLGLGAIVDRIDPRWGVGSRSVEHSCCCPLSQTGSVGLFSVCCWEPPWVRFGAWKRPPTFATTGEVTSEQFEELRQLSDSPQLHWGRCILLWA
jgi:MFS family permease